MADSQFGSSTPWAKAAKNLNKAATPKGPTKTPTKTATKPKATTDPTLAPKWMQDRTAYENAFKPGGALYEGEPSTKTITPLDWKLESDPTYQMALAQGQSQFNLSRNQALADKQAAEAASAAERKSLDVGATESRRRLAGNYAARGMAGGAAGALSQAEARANAEQIAARTSIQNKIDALNQQYLSNYGATGSDWTGTLIGQQYTGQAAQQAIAAQLARYGSI